MLRHCSTTIELRATGGRGAGVGGKEGERMREVGGQQWPNGRSRAGLGRGTRDAPQSRAVLPHIKSRVFSCLTFVCVFVFMLVFVSLVTTPAFLVSCAYGSLVAALVLVASFTAICPPFRSAYPRAAAGLPSEPARSNGHRLGSDLATHFLPTPLAGMAQAQLLKQHHGWDPARHIDIVPCHLPFDPRPGTAVPAFTSFSTLDAGELYGYGLVRMRSRHVTMLSSWQVLIGYASLRLFVSSIPRTMRRLV
ncbi:hypothetical protein ANO11243_021950 [Dothideomycetidae sp. 11243]|nr:hypothetical protein ANO11243_021950 [fungal sp. No.11243]